MVRYVGTGPHATVASVLRERAELTPDAPFVTCSSGSHRFAEALQRAEQAAAALSHLGVGVGDKVAVMLPNGIDFLDLWFGTALLGAVLVPVNTGLVGDGLRHVLTHSDSAVLVAAGSFVDPCDAALAGTSVAVRRVGLFDGAPPDGPWIDGRSWLGGTYAEPPRPAIAPDTLASITYTSGTTGPAKGVMNGHRPFVATGLQFARGSVRVTDDDVLYTSLPLFHVNAQMLSTMGALVSGTPLVLAERFSASGFLDDVRRANATVFNYIGAMLTMIAKQPPREDDATTRLRLAVGGAAPPELWRPFERRFGLSILEMYGLTETATVCVGNPADDVRVGRIGRALPWAQARIAGPDGVAVAVGDPGEIQVRSATPGILFQGYYKNPDATRDSHVDGWFRTGDRGVVDEDGYVAFLDRIKDVIRRRGENISSAEVERAVNLHPQVAESAVVGVPSELGEEDVMVVVVPVDGEPPTGDELLEHCRRHLAAFMLPRYVRTVAALPKTATERVQKFKLREQPLDGDVWDREASTV